MRKKLFFIGAGADQVPAIQYAKDQGYYIITCDYLPKNPGHQYADESYEVSTLDKEAVLDLAKGLNVDGVLAYGSDINAATQVYVRKMLGLPSNSPQSIFTLTHKNALRDFLKEHGFYTTLSMSFSSYEEVMENIQSYSWPLIVKPIDNAGSNGVSKVEELSKLKDAVDKALKFSRKQEVIVEEFFKGASKIYDGEGFILDGELVCLCIADNFRLDDLNPLVPVGVVFPTSLNESLQSYARQELARLFSLLDFNSGPFNVEFAFDEDGNFFIIDIGPRNGGAPFPQTIKFATGIDMFELAVKDALGMVSLAQIEGKKGMGEYISSYVVFSSEEGTYSGVEYSPEVTSRIIEEWIRLQGGEKLERAQRAASRIGEVYMSFQTKSEMLDMMANIQKHIKVGVE